MARKKNARAPRAEHAPKDKVPVLGAQPESYLRERPVWQFQSFDWDGPWGLKACATCNDWRKHIEQHLASLETMTWDEILKASGGKREGKGNNNHHIHRDKFSKRARGRLGELQIYAEQLFSLRLDSCTRLYGVREGTCLRIVWFDPYHCERGGNAVYDWKPK